MGKRIITAVDVQRAAEAGETSILVSGTQCIITPSAFDMALELGVELQEKPEGSTGTTGHSACAPCSADAAQQEEFNEVVMQVCRIMKAQLPEELDPAQLERVVREVVSARFCGGAQGPAAGSDQQDLEGVCLISSKQVLAHSATGSDASSTGVAGSMIVADAIGPNSDAALQAKLSGGYMAWEKASFPRTLEENEIAVVIEGELHLTVGGNTVVGKAGDMLYLPQGTNVLYSTPGKVKLACINNLQ